MPRKHYEILKLLQRFQTFRLECRQILSLLLFFQNISSEPFDFNSCIVGAAEPLKKNNAHKGESGVYSQLFYAVYDPYIFSTPTGKSFLLLGK